MPHFGENFASRIAAKLLWSALFVLSTSANGKTSAVTSYDEYHRRDTDYQRYDNRPILSAHRATSLCAIDKLCLSTIPSEVIVRPQNAMSVR